MYYKNNCCIEYETTVSRQIQGVKYDIEMSQNKSGLLEFVVSEIGRFKTILILKN